MWKIAYEDRLTDWVSLRQSVNSLPLENQLSTINDWWFRAPMVNRVITWSDTDNWPDPWTLLTHNGYCDLARSLGIVYTLMLIDEPKYQELSIVHIGNDNLVLVDHGKYILNWAPGEMLNISSIQDPVQRSISSTELHRFLT